MELVEGITRRRERVGKPNKRYDEIIMKITKSQLRRIIKEEKARILRESPLLRAPSKIKQAYFPSTDARLSSPGDDAEFSQSAIDEMQYAIEMFLDDGYEADAKDLERVFNTALHDMSAMGEPSQKLINMYQKLDDMASGEIPYEIGGWIRGETW